MRSYVVVLVAGLLAAHTITIGAGQTGRTGTVAADGAITGRVTDPQGRPVPGTIVTLLQQRDPFSNGMPRLGPVNVRLLATVNGRGEFEFERLSPGEYYVVALPQNPPLKSVDEDRSGYAVTYYPGSIRSSDAARVDVGANASVRADITLAPARLAVVSGMVVASPGRRFAGGVIGLAYGQPLFGISQRPVTIGRDGRFVITGLAPGTCTLQANEGPLRGADTPRISAARITVADRDLSNVRLMPVEMVRVSGRLIDSDPARASTIDPAAFQIGATPMYSEGPSGPQRPGTARSDFSFEFRTWPGLGIVRVSSGRQLVPARVLLNGKDVTASGIEFRQRQHISGLEIELLPQKP